MFAKLELSRQIFHDEAMILNGVVSRFRPLIAFQLMSRMIVSRSKTMYLGVCSSSKVGTDERLRASMCA